VPGNLCASAFDAPALCLLVFRPRRGPRRVARRHRLFGIMPGPWRCMDNDGRQTAPRLCRRRLPPSIEALLIVELDGPGRVLNLIRAVGRDRPLARCPHVPYQPGRAGGVSVLCRPQAAFRRLPDHARLFLSSIGSCSACPPRRSPGARCRLMSKAHRLLVVNASLPATAPSSAGPVSRHDPRRVAPRRGIERRYSALVFCGWGGADLCEPRRRHRQSAT